MKLPANIAPSWRPYLRGRCFDFALALHKLLPGSRLVAFGSVRFPGHVAVQVGESNQLIDIRGPLPIEEMLRGMAGEASALDQGPLAATVDEVALHMGFTAENLRLPADVRKMAKERLAQFVDQLDWQPSPVGARAPRPR